MSVRSAYLDYNAGAPLRPEARAALIAALDSGGNPSSVHGEGRRAKAQLESAREAVAAAVGALAENVVFTSGATEALHLALEASSFARLAVSAIEHDAVFAQAARSGAAVIPSDASGRIDLQALDHALARADGPVLLALMLVNNAAGVVQPVAEAAAIVRQHGGALLCDAAQALGRIPVDMQALGADYLVVSSHKVGGPSGVGALALAPGAPFRAPRAGGGQERGRRPGTENAPAAAGFAAAVRACVAELGAEPARTAALRQAAETGLRRLAPDFVVFGAGAPRAANTLCCAIPGLTAQTALIGLDLAGVRVASGAACSSGKVHASRVLTAMGVERRLADCALRISFGWASAPEDVDQLLAAMAPIVARTAQLQGAA